MKILIVGSGGREHALAWKFAQSPKVSEVLVAPGNGGTATEPRVRNVDVASEDIAGLIALAQGREVGLTIIGPEAPLVIGVVDAFLAAGLRCFGPRQAAAQLEGSKAFTKEFLKRHGIPTAAYATFTQDNFDPAWVRAQRAPIVVKASGPGGRQGRGHRRRVRKPSPPREACSPASSAPPAIEVVIEEFLQGEEASFIVMADGKNVLTMATSQDHKRLKDADAARIPAAWAPTRRRRWSPRDARAHHARGHRADHPRPRRGRHAVHRIPVRRHHGAAGWHAERARVQLPFRRSGDAAHHDAAARAISWSCARPRSTSARSVQAEWDPRAALGVVLAAAAIRTRCARAMPSPGWSAAGCRARCFTPARAPRTARWSPTAGVCCAPWVWAAASRGAGAGLCARGRGLLARNAMPARYRVSRHRERETATEATELRALDHGAQVLVVGDRGASQTLRSCKSLPAPSITGSPASLVIGVTVIHEC